MPAKKKPSVNIAVFSDVHGNLPALRAVLADIRGKNPDLVLCAGDLVGYGPFPGEVVDLVQSRGILTVQGNYDDAVANFRLVCGCDYKSDRAREIGEHSIIFAKTNTTDSQKGYLAALPPQLFVWPGSGGLTTGQHPPKAQVQPPAVGLPGKEISVPAWPGRRPDLDAGAWLLHLVHGSPRRLNEYLRADTPEEVLAEIAASTPANILVFGHTHQCMHRLVDGVRFIGTGSAGKPKLGNPNPCYAWIEISDTVKVDFIEATYDVRQVVEAMQSKEIPPELIDIIRTGRE
ncbi:MAG: metallophosphoesterase [Bacillota bacterium]